MAEQFRRIVPAVLALVVISGALVLAADVTKALNEAEGRKRAAENGARAIQAKSPQQVDQVKTLYTDTASAHNTWLEAMTAAVEQGAVSDAVKSSAAAAASSLVQWVAARNRALGESVLAGNIATIVETSTRQELIDIATETARKYQGGDARKRTQAVAALSSRLRWKTWGEL